MCQIRDYIEVVFNDVSSTHVIELAKQNVLAFYASARSRDSFMTLEKEQILLKTRFLTLCQHKFDSNVEQVIHETILSAAYRAEVLSPGSFDKVLEKLVNSNEDSSSHSTFFSSRVPTTSDIEVFLNKTITEKTVKNMVIDALTIAGFGSKLMLEKTRGRPHVEHVSGYSFQLKPAIKFSSSLSSCRIICVDGFIESVGEVNALLEQAVESKEPCLLFTRGLHDDVRQTIAVNNLRGSFKIVPVIVEFDTYGLNTLVDIAIAAGGDVVSTNKGELISTIKLSEQPVVERADVFEDRIVIYNKKTKTNVQKHLSNLFEKRANSHHEFHEFIDSRIKSLSSNVVFVRLSDDHLFVQRSQMIDLFLRTLKNVMAYGVIDDGSSVLPATSSRVSDLYASRCRQSLKNIGAIITDVT